VDECDMEIDRAAAAPVPCTMPLLLLRQDGSTANPRGEGGRKKEQR
jgi:hypothetical protein